MTTTLFQGSMTAIVTPFKDGRVDEDSFRKLINWQIVNGIDVLVPCGTTGESATITPEEHEQIIRIAVEESAGRVPVLAGSGSNSTATAVKLAKQAKNAGANGTLQVTPYYNKPTQEGLYRHFATIAEVVDLPMLLYNVPGRTGVNMKPETVLQLAHIDSIVGIKEASGDIAQVKQIIANAPPAFVTISGEDAMNLEIYKAGGKGCISVTANIVPDRVARVWDFFQNGNIDEAKRIQEDLADLNRAMFLETNPIPAKTALAYMGRCKEEFRLPLTCMGQTTKEELVSILRNNNII